MDVDDDTFVALLLHEELNGTKESHGDKKENRLVSKVTSLIDPEWEMVDPNPDIVQLFRAFNGKFFWNMLGAVEVKWSPRMYSCAGICTYKGAGGCIVSLSLPLLKLRPRKDLVETLLHEMIHAFLFIAKNDKDRDGHGPEFHKHMYRINKEAGTNITVYHTFHDEVRHYRTHVWRCDGPCKTKPPYFGLVRRAMNRAPGPNDFWYAEHRQKCGGTFTKIEEPENFKSRKKQNVKDALVPKKVNSNQSPSVTGKQQEITSFFSPTTMKDQNNISSNTINRFVTPNTGGGTITKHGKTSNLHGFTNLSKPGKSGPSGLPKVKQAKPGGNFQGGTMMANRGGTLLERPKTLPSLAGGDQIKDPPPKSSIVPFSGEGHILSSGTVNDKRKSKLLTLYPSSKIEVAIKKPALESSLSTNDNNNLVSCPVCSELTKQSDINEHLDECTGLEKVFESTNTIVLDSDDDDDSNNTDGASAVNSQFFPCPNCSELCKESDINNHLDHCLSFN